MEGSVRILIRFIGATVIISTLLFIVNFILAAWITQDTFEEVSPDRVVRHVAEGLYHSSSSILDPSTKELLDENEAWAMLVNESGQVVWKYNLPEEIPETYSLTEVSKFSKWYLKDYPVFTWEHEEGLVVVGYPKDSFAKYQHILPVQWVSSFPLMVVGLLVINMFLALLLSQ